MICFEALMATMYGLFVNFLHTQNFHYDIYASLILLALVAMLLLGTSGLKIGFGMLVTFDGAGSATGLINNMLILCIVVQLYFLFNVFFTRMQIQPSIETYATRIA